MTRAPNAVAIHEAAYAVKARRLDVALRPPELKRLRRYYCDVVDFTLDDLSEQFCTDAARVMWAGDAGLQLLAPDARGNTRDEMEARDLLYLGFRRRGAGNLHVPSIHREFHLTITRMQFEAAVFVRENQAEITTVAEQLRGTAGKSVPTPAQQSRQQPRLTYGVPQSIPLGTPPQIPLKSPAK